MTARRIAVVDDDPRMRALIRRALEAEGFAIDEAGDAAALMALLADRHYALITLDLGLPDSDGFDVARTLRHSARTPVIMVTGKGDVFDKVVGLEVGADDYVAKPFHVRELVARVKAVLRRGTDASEAGSTAEDAYVVDGYRMFPLRRTVLSPDGSEVRMTSSEFDLLFALVKAKGRPLSRGALLDAVHGRDAGPFDRTIDNMVARLRKRISPSLIRTVRSIGYQLGGPVRAERLVFELSAPHHPGERSGKL